MCETEPTLKYYVLFSKENMRCEQVRGEGRSSYLLYFDNCACLRQSIRRCVFILWVGHIHSGTGHDCAAHTDGILFAAYRPQTYRHRYLVAGTSRERAVG